MNTTLRDSIRKRKDPDGFMLAQFRREMDGIIADGKRQLNEAISEARSRTIFDEIDSAQSVIKNVAKETALDHAKSTTDNFERQMREVLKALETQRKDILNDTNDKILKAVDKFSKQFASVETDTKKRLTKSEAATAKELDKVKEKLVADAEKMVRQTEKNVQVLVDGFEERLQDFFANAATFKGDKGDPGENAKPETAESIAKKLNMVEQSVNFNVIKGLDEKLEQLRKNIKQSKGGKWGGGGKLIISDEGTEVDDNVRSINFTGNAVTATGDRDITVDITAVTGDGAAGLFKEVTSTSKSVFSVGFDLPVSSDDMLVFIDGALAASAQYSRTGTQELTLDQAVPAGSEVVVALAGNQAGAAGGVTQNFIPLKGATDFENSAMSEGATEIVSTKTITSPGGSLNVGSLKLSNHGTGLTLTDRARNNVLHAILYDFNNQPFFWSFGNLIDRTSPASATEAITGTSIQFTLAPDTERIVNRYTIESNTAVTDVNITVRVGSHSATIPVFDYKRDSEAEATFDLSVGTNNIDLPVPVFLRNGVTAYITISSPNSLSLQGENLSGSLVPFFAERGRNLTRTVISTSTAIRPLVPDLAGGALIQLRPSNEDWDASSGEFPNGAQAGYLYKVSTGGTVDSIEFDTHDLILALVDNASTNTYDTNWLRIEGDEGVSVWGGLTGVIDDDEINTIVRRATRLDDELTRLRNEFIASGRTINVFNDGFTVDGANYNTYVGKNNIYGAARDKVVQVRLPTEAHVTTAGASYPIEIEFQHFGGTTRSDTTNQVVIATQNSEELREGSATGNLRTSIVLRRGDVAVFTKSGAGQPYIVTLSPMDPRSAFLPEGLFTLNTRTASIAIPSGGSDYQVFGLTGITPVIGDAFEVTAGGIPSGADFPEIAIGDVIVSKVNNPSLVLSSSNDDWLVIRDTRNFPLTSQEIRFLSQITEVTGTIDTGFVDAQTNDALIWLSPAVLATAPFLTPSADGDNPRTPEVVTYVGGREDRDSNNQFTITEDRDNTYMYVGITPSYAISTGAENIDIVIRGVDGNEVSRFNLATDFVFTDASDFTNPTVRHYFYSTDGTNPATFNYTTNQVIEINDVRIGRRYTANSETVNATPNVSNLPEAQLSEGVRVKLNRLPDNTGTLPEPLQAFNNQASVERRTHSTAVSNSDNIDIDNTFVFLKNDPDNTVTGIDYPLTAGEFDNEISESSVTVADPSDLSSILIKNMDSNGVETVTNRVMTGAAIEDDSFVITMPEDNFRLVLGCWFYPKSTASNHILGVKVDSSSAVRTLFRANAGNLEYIRETSPGVFDHAVISDGFVNTEKLHKVIFSFRRAASGDNPDHLECVLVFYGYDANGNPQIFDENTITDFGFDWTDLDWTQLTVGGGAIIVQNVQGFVLESTTPLFEFPRHATLRDWEEHHGNQFDDYLWDNLSVTNTDTERVIIEEPVYFNNLLNDTNTIGPEVRTLESKMEALFPLTPDVDDLIAWADIFNPAQASQVVNIIAGYSLLADYRSDSDRYESAGVTYDATGANVVDYTGLTDDLKRIFGFQVSGASAKTLMSIVDGMTVIPYFRITAAGLLQVNDYTPARTANETVTNEYGLATLSAGTLPIAGNGTATATFTLPNLPANSTNITRTAQLDIHIFEDGRDTLASGFVDFAVPVPNTAQSKRTIDHVFQTSFTNTFRATIGYEFRVSGSDLLLDITIESAESRYTYGFDSVATLSTYTHPTTVSRVDNWRSFTDSGGDFTFSGSTDFVIGFQPITSGTGMNVVVVAQQGSNTVEQLNDIFVQIPAPRFSAVQIPDDIEFRTAVSNHWFRHLDLASLLTNKDTKWVYGLALLRTVTELAITGEVDFTSALKTQGEPVPGVSTGSVAPTSTPQKIGDIYVDTTGKTIYVAVGTGGSGDWTAVN